MGHKIGCHPRATCCITFGTTFGTIQCQQWGFQRAGSNPARASNFFFFFFFRGKKIWNASRICVSSLRRGHANLLCIVPILIYVLPKSKYTSEMRYGA